IDVLTLAGSLRQHLGGGLETAAQYLARAEDLVKELAAAEKSTAHPGELPDDLLRAKVMLSIQQGRADEACRQVEHAANTRGWLDSDAGDPMLVSEGDTQWWGENRLREEFRDLALSIALVGDRRSDRCVDVAFRLTLATKGRLLDATTRKIAWL